MPSLAMSTGFMAKRCIAALLIGTMPLFPFLLSVPQVFAPAHSRLLQPAIDAGTSAMAVLLAATMPVL